MEIKVKGHKTPTLSQKVLRQDLVNIAMRYNPIICSFCGHYHLKGYVCSCGMDKGYADERDENGNLVEVYFKVF